MSSQTDRRILVIGAAKELMARRAPTSRHICARGIAVRSLVPRDDDRSSFAQGGNARRFRRPARPHCGVGDAAGNWERLLLALRLPRGSGATKLPLIERDDAACTAAGVLAQPSRWAGQRMIAIGEASEEDDTAREVSAAAGASLLQGGQRRGLAGGGAGAREHGERSENRTSFGAKGDHADGRAGAAGSIPAEAGCGRRAGGDPAQHGADLARDAAAAFRLGIPNRQIGAGAAP